RLRGCRARDSLVAPHREGRLGPACFRQPWADRAFLANLDGDRLRPPVREALANLRRLDRLAKLQSAPATSEGQRPLLLLFDRVLFLLVRVGHLDPIPLSCRAGRATAGSTPWSTIAPQRKPASFSASPIKRPLKRPPLSAAFTT